MMRKEKLLTFYGILIVVFFNSCKDHYPEQDYYQVIHNASGHHADLTIAWETDSVMYSLPEGDSLLIPGVCYGVSATECYFDYDFEGVAHNSLSTYVVFDETRVKHYPTGGCTGERQILGAYGGTIEECGYEFAMVGDRFAFVFEISAEDYDTSDTLRE